MELLEYSTTPEDRPLAEVGVDAKNAQYYPPRLSYYHSFLNSCNFIYFLNRHCFLLTGVSVVVYGGEANCALLDLVCIHFTHVLGRVRQFLLC
jgi:hypothetical protein